MITFLMMIEEKENVTAMKISLVDPGNVPLPTEREIVYSEKLLAALCEGALKVGQDCKHGAKMATMDLRATVEMLKAARAKAAAPPPPAIEPSKIILPGERGYQRPPD